VVVLVDASLAYVAIANGLGRSNTGDIASRLIIDTVSQALRTLATTPHRNPEVFSREAEAQPNARVYP